MIQPVRLLAAAAVCAALLVPARIAFGAPALTAAAVKVPISQAGR